MAYFKDRPEFGGVFSNDQLTKTDKNKFYILNLQNSGLGGSHWTLLCNSYYFDPYGAPPTKAISKFVKWHNPHQYQGLNSNACGYFCMYFAENMSHGIDPARGMIPGKFEHNENVLKKYFIK
jgi:hypothetical protein